MIISRKSWHYRFNCWANDKLGTDNIEKHRTLCTYFWATVGNFFLLLTSPIWWILTEPITPENTPYKIAKEDAVFEEGRYTPNSRFEACGTGLLAIVFFGSLIVASSFPFMAVGIRIFGGAWIPKLLALSIISFIMYFLAIMIFLTENSKSREFFSMLKAKTCPIVHYSHDGKEIEEEPEFDKDDPNAEW